MIYASVDQGHLELRNHDRTKRIFSLDDRGKSALAETLKEWDIVEEDIMCSSSVDFSEAYGAPEDLDVNDWIYEARMIAAGPPNIYFKVEQLEEIVQHLRDGKVAEVIERLENNIKMSKEACGG